MLMEHMGNVGTSLRWELQLLATPAESESIYRNAGRVGLPFL
jgi:hypothetical protein